MSSNFSRIEILELLVGYALNNSGLPIDFLQSECSRQLSLFVLRRYFSDDWIKRFFYNNLVGTSNDDFLEFPYKYISIDDHRQRLGRLIGFSSCLLNLGDVKGFDQTLRTIKHNTKNGSQGSFESGYTELLAAKFLYLVNINFEFNQPTGGGKSIEKGWKKNYDLKATLANGRKLAIEVKCMTNESELNENSFLSVLSKAIRQLSDDARKVVFIKVPETWLYKQGFEYGI